MNAGTVNFSYKNADAWSSTRLAAISSPNIDNAQHHVVQIVSPNGGTAMGSGLEQTAMLMDWNEYKTAYDIGMADGWDAPGTDLGHVVAFMIGNCGTGSVYPAVRGDGSFPNPDMSQLVEGALMTFRADSTPPTSPELMPLYNTCKRYGFIPADKTGGGCEFLWRWWGYPGVNLPFPGPPTFKIGSQFYGPYMRQLPWHQMQIIDPVAVQAGW
jgi:hypothetical protein